jgi:ribosome recycling factor
LGDKAEQTRQTIRKIREDAWNKIQAAQKAKEISEDDKFRGKDELQKVVDDFNEKVKNLVEKKKTEIS